MFIYRVFPVLWNDGATALNVYGIDRAPRDDAFPTACSSRVKEDPISYTAGTTFLRILPPPSSGYGPHYVTWDTLPAWLSYVSDIGFSYTGDISKLKPYSSFYVSSAA